MRVEDLPLSGLKLIQLDVFADERGIFTEWYRASKLSNVVGADFVQDNFSRSKAGVFRGMHAQFRPAQGKLVGVSRGRILDVVIDIREGSPTFGQKHAIELGEERRELLWVPAGYAHGFFVLGDGDADVYYKCDAEYSPEGEIGLLWSDPAFGLGAIISQPIVSSRDQGLMSWKDYCRQPRFEYLGDGRCRPTTSSHQS